MTTRLEGPLKREIQLGGEPYTLTIGPQGFMLVRKGRRKGVELAWSAIVNGEAALAVALNASVHGDMPPVNASDANGQDSRNLRRR